MNIEQGSNKTKVVVSTSAHREKNFRDKQMDLYVPVDQYGDVVGITKADRLECWELREVTRPFQMEFNIRELAFAIVREGSDEDFAPLQHWIAYKALIHYNAWRKHLHRAPEKDIYRFEVVLK